MRGKRLQAALGALLVVIGLGAAGRWALRYYGPLLGGWGPELSGVAELDAPVRIVRDGLGVPHVEAGSRDDAFLALGFVHARDRLWQMEILRRTAHGRLSELFGEATLAADRLARTLGLARAARAEQARLSKRTRALLEAYSAGVNHCLDEIRARHIGVPFELRWLGIDPEPWTPVDTLAILRLRSWLLGRSLGATLLLDRLVREIGGVASQGFFPEPVYAGDADRVGALLRLGRASDTLARLAGLPGRSGSLGFVVGPRRSRRGAPLLANDPHVGFRLPAVFYLAHLRSPDWEVAGATWPGIPVFWTGTNRAIAWGQVVVHASASDLFEETFDPEDPVRYQRGERWLRAETRIERIEVRGAARPLEVQVRTTEHGPLLGSVLPDDPVAQTLAIAWTGLSRSSGLEALLAIQQARDWEAFVGPLRRFPGPVSTFLYADAEGRIGSQLAGHLPLRVIQTGLLPVPGRSRYYDWRGLIPFRELPSRSGDEIEWIVADPRPSPDGFPHPLTWLWGGGAAGARLRELLARRDRLSLADVLVLQRERHSGVGVAAVHELLENLEPEREGGARVRELLLAWDGHTDLSSAGAAAYHVFRAQLARRLLATRLDPETAREVAAASEPLPGVLLARFVDRTAHREGAPAVRAALEDTWDWLRRRASPSVGRWTWGGIHRLTLRHDFERLGGLLLRPIGRLLGRGPFPVPGDPDSVWTMHRESLSSDAAVGPALRYAVDLADVDHARFGLAGGQSGDPASDHYDDGIEDWLRARPRLLRMHAADIREHAIDEIRLTPAAPDAARKADPPAGG